MQFSFPKTSLKPPIHRCTVAKLLNASAGSKQKLQLPIPLVLKTALFDQIFVSNLKFSNQ